MVKVLENVFRRIICSFAVNNWSNCGDTETRCFHYFRRPCHGPYIYLLHILKNSSAAENCTGVRLGQVFNLSIFYNIRKSWLQTFHGFDFSFRWRDDENHQMGTHLSVKLHQKIRKVKSSHMFGSGRLAKLTIYFLRLIFNVRVYNGAFWPFRFYGVHFTHDSQNRFTNTKYGRWRRHENKLARPPSYP